jgi:zinc/manganese transport system ATP-binding protein
MNTKIEECSFEQAKNCIAQVGLQGFENRYITDLSKGQLQRVLFAKIMLQQSTVIFLDEPFNAIDTKTTQDLLNILVNLRNKGVTIVIVLHDLLQVERCCDNAILLASELVSYGCLADVLSRENLQTAYNTNFIWSSDICNQEKT